MPKGEEEANCNGSLPFLHEFAGHVVDGRDGLRRRRVADRKWRERSCSEEERVVVETVRPKPRRDIGTDKQHTDADHFGTHIYVFIGEQADYAVHRCLLTKPRSVGG